MNCTKFHIAILGFMGTGKSTSGKILADILELKFIDVDEFIVSKKSMSIKDIFKYYGEDYFRKLETEALKEIIDWFTIGVISTGGGIVEKPENWELLKSRAVTVSLFAQPETILCRLKNDKQRPLLDKTNPMNTIETLFKKRRDLYNQSDIIIWTDRLTPKEVAERIKRELLENGYIR